MIIGGDWDSTAIGFLSYQVRRCFKETELKYNIKCATAEDIKKMPEIYYTIFKYETVVDPTNSDIQLILDIVTN